VTCLVCNKCFLLLHRVVNVCPGIIIIYVSSRERVQTGPRGVLFKSPFSEFEQPWDSLWSVSCAHVYHTPTLGKAKYLYCILSETCNAIL
jgi:hypothetical protein